MAQLHTPHEIETIRGIYVFDEFIGEGGAGRVFGGHTDNQDSVAMKILKVTGVSTDKRKRFRNELAFLERNIHKNIVSVIDSGMSTTPALPGPFYIMRRFDGNLRQLMSGGIAADEKINLFTQIMNGVEAAHLCKVLHRDLKPENVLYSGRPPTLVVADFGTARFQDEAMATAVKTGDAQRLASFAYSAPEQKIPGAPTSSATDIFALGLILNELFTGSIPQGTSFRQIGSVAPEWAYLDQIVEVMLRQDPEERPQSVSAVRSLLQMNGRVQDSGQKISRIDSTIIPEGDIDDPLALAPPVVVGIDWRNGRLYIELDQDVTPQWINALQNMGSYAALQGCGPGAFKFNGRSASVSVSESSVQAVINHFKSWLPKASLKHKESLERELAFEKRKKAELLAKELAAEEARLRILKNTRF